VERVKAAAIAGTILATHIALSVQAQEKKPWKVSELCGRVDYVQRMPEGKSAATFIEKRRPIPNLIIELYESSGSNKSIDSARTDKRGGFEFKNPQAGSYWLSMNWNSCRKCGLAVVFAPAKSSGATCSRQGIAIDDVGSANWWTTVDVD
jgi:hypothetical protein